MPSFSVHEKDRDVAFLSIRFPEPTTWPALFTETAARLRKKAKKLVAAPRSTMPPFSVHENAWLLPVQEIPP